MKENVLYVIQNINFFSSTYSIGGHLSHFEGIYDVLRKRYETAVTVIDSKSTNRIENKNWHLYVPSTVWKRVFAYIYYCIYIKDIARTINPVFIYTRAASSFMPFIPFLKHAVKCPLILELNDVGYTRRYFLRLTDYIGLYFVDVIACNSEGTKKKVINLSKSFSKKTIVVPNGISDSFITKEKRHVRGKEFNIGFFGTFKDGKYGIDTLIKAFIEIEYSNCILHLYGLGPYLSKLKELSNGHPRIRFHGSIAHDKVANVLQSMDLLVNTSYFENQSSIKVFEYMGSGIPMVIANNPEDSKTLGYGEFGFIYDGGNVEDLKENILKVYEDYDSALVVAQKAHAEVVAKHTWDIRVDTIVNKLELMK